MTLLIGSKDLSWYWSEGGGGRAAGGGCLELMFTRYVPLASQSPYSIIVYFLANYRAHLSYFLEM